jgi:hypothetical protein
LGLYDWQLIEYDIHAIIASFFFFMKLVNALLKGCQRLHIPGTQTWSRHNMIMDLDHGFLRLRNVTIQVHGNCWQDAITPTSIESILSAHSTKNSLMDALGGGTDESHILRGGTTAGAHILLLEGRDPGGGPTGAQILLEGSG